MKVDYYPIEDYIPLKDMNDLGIIMRQDGQYYNLIGGIIPVKIWAVPTGEFRTPKRSEWYISNDLKGHRAESDLTTEYHIAKLTKLRVTIAEIERGL